MIRIREEELLALELLKKHFPQYSGLELSDKPDLVDLENSIGVEVTSASNPKVREREAFYWKKLHGRNIKNFTKTQINLGEEYGLSLLHTKNDGEIFSLARTFGAEEQELLHKAIVEKYQKTYQQLNQIDLYIFFRQYCAEGFSYDDLQGLFQTAHQCEKKYSEAFGKIMVDFYSKLLTLDIRNNSIKVIIDYDK